MSRLVKIIAGLALGLVVSVPALAADVTVFAAASLTDALTEIGKSYQQKTGNVAAISFAASSVLARQIEKSEDADVFVSPDPDWMDYLENRGLVRPATRRNLLASHLVLI